MGGIAVLASLLLSFISAFVFHHHVESSIVDSLQEEAVHKTQEVISLIHDDGELGALGLIGLARMDLKSMFQGAAPKPSSDLDKLMNNLVQMFAGDSVYITGQDGMLKAAWGPGSHEVTHDLSFRPYVRKALMGERNAYAAFSPLTGNRFLYLAAPIYAENTKDSPVVGTVVLRTYVSRLDSLLLQQGNIALLLSPQGLVFASNHEQWISHLAQPATPQLLAQIQRVRQFGTEIDAKEPAMLPFSLTDPVVIWEGKRYVHVAVPLRWKGSAGDWQLVVLEDVAATFSIWHCIAVGLLVFVLLGLVFILTLRMLRSRYLQQLTTAKLDEVKLAQNMRHEREIMLGEVTQRFQQCADIPALGNCYLATVHKLLGAMQGVVYAHRELNRDPRAAYELIAQFACAEPPASSIQPNIQPGEQLLGQCLAERRLIIQHHIPANYWRIQSGLGASAPQCLVLIPIMLGDVLLGAAELACLHAPSQEDVEILQRLTGTLALNMEILRNTVNTEQILAATMAELANRGRKSFLSALLDALPYPLFYKDANGILLGLNRAYEEFFDMDTSPLIGKHVLELDYLPEADRVSFHQEDLRVIAQCLTIRRRIHLFARGEWREVLYSVAGFAGDDGKPAGMVGVFMGINVFQPEQDDSMISAVGNKEDVAE